MRARDNMDGDDLADLLRPTRSGFDRRFDRRDVAPYDGGDEPAAGLLIGDQLDLGRLDHRIGRLDHGGVALGLDHPQRFGWTVFFSHSCLLMT